MPGGSSPLRSTRLRVTRRQSYWRYRVAAFRSATRSHAAFAFRSTCTSYGNSAYPVTKSWRWARWQTTAPALSTTSSSNRSESATTCSGQSSTARWMRYAGANEPIATHVRKPRSLVERSSSWTTDWRPAPRCGPQPRPCARASRPQSSRRSRSRPGEPAAPCASVVDRIVCVHTPEPFHAVGLYYENFAQTSDDDVRRLLVEGETGRRRSA